MVVDVIGCGGMPIRGALSGSHLIPDSGVDSIRQHPLANKVYASQNK